MTLFDATVDVATFEMAMDLAWLDDPLPYWAVVYATELEKEIERFVEDWVQSNL